MDIRTQHTRSTEVWIDQTSPHRYRALTNFDVGADSAGADPRALVCASGPTVELAGTLDTYETLMFVPPDTLKPGPVGSAS